MSSRQRKLNRRWLKEAEGYLELATLFVDEEINLSREQQFMLAEKCLASLDRVVEPGIRKGRVMYMKGQAFRLSDRYDEAIIALEASGELDSSNIHTCLALGWCYKRKQQLGLAVEALQKAIAINRDSGIAHYNMACYLALLNQAEMALIHLDAAIEIDESFRESAKTETDFDSIRGTAEFQSKTVVA